MSQPFIREGADTSDPQIDSGALLAAGKTFLGRYISDVPNPGIMTLAEAISRSQAGLDLFSIYETSPTDFENGQQAGITAGTHALAGAKQVHQPPGTPIYFAADTDTNNDPVLLEELQAYLTGCASAVSPMYTVGIYGGTDALTAMASNGSAQFFWQSESTGFAGGANATQNPHDHLWQYFPPTVPGTDNNHAVQAWFGQWRAPLVTTDLYAVWRGSGNDETVWWSTFNGHMWSAQQRVAGIGSSEGPALAMFNGVPYMTWKGRGGDQDLWWSTFDGKTWAPQKVVPGSGSNSRPAMTLFGGRLYMAWRGVAGDESLYWSAFDGKAWTPQQKVPAAGSANGPALAPYGNSLLMAWRGSGADESLWWSTFDGRTWAPQQKSPDTGSADGPALALADNALYRAWRGAHDDGSLYWSTFDGKTWAPQQKIPGTGSISRPALALFNDTIFAAWRGAAGDEALYWSMLVGGNWAPQQKIPGAGSTAGPALLAP